MHRRCRLTMTDDRTTTLASSPGTRDWNMYDKAWTVIILGLIGEVFDEFDNINGVRLVDKVTKTHNTKHKHACSCCCAPLPSLCSHTPLPYSRLWDARHRLGSRCGCTMTTSGGKSPSASRKPWTLQHVAAVPASSSPSRSSKRREQFDVCNSHSFKASIVQFKTLLHLILTLDASTSQNCQAQWC